MSRGKVFFLHFVIFFSHVKNKKALDTQAPFGMILSSTARKHRLFGNDNVHSYDYYYENHRNNSCKSCEELVPFAGSVFTDKGINASHNYAGFLILTRLQKNECCKNGCDDHYCYTQNYFQNVHYIHLNKLFYKWRREWDSNPRALADKRFSRPPRYDHFDTSPYTMKRFCFSAKMILSSNNYNVNIFLKFFQNFSKCSFPSFPSISCITKNACAIAKSSGVVILIFR